jgi:hypothetical protein
MRIVATVLLQRDLANAISGCNNELLTVLLNISVSERAKADGCQALLLRWLSWAAACGHLLAGGQQEDSRACCTHHCRPALCQSVIRFTGIPHMPSPACLAGTCCT